MRGRLIGVTAAIMIISAFAASVAQAKIVIGEGADGIALGASKASVLKSHGQPFRVLGRDLVYGHPCLCTVGVGSSGVRSIDVLSKTQRTDKGVGPGSTYEEVVAAYPEARCYHPSVYGPHSRMCSLLTTDSDRKVKTTFAFFEESLPCRDVEIRSG
jgi:hypothetical protein